MVVISYEMARSQAGELAAAGFRVVVLDEVSSVKGAETEHRAVCKITASADRVVALTATPLENDAMETYAILQTLHLPDLWGWFNFRRDFVLWSDSRVDSRGRPIDPKPIGLVAARLPELRDFLNRYCLRRTAGEVGLPLPERVGERIRWLPPTAAQQRAYARAMAMPAGLARHRAMEQAANVVDGESPKAEAAVEEIQIRPGEKVIVWGFHQEHLDVLTRLLDEAGIRWARIDGRKTPAARVKALDEFRNNPDVRVLVGTDAFASGLNLQHARVMISLGCSYNPGKETQREGRIRRVGSPHATYEHVVLLTDLPQERRKAQTLDRKGSDATAVFG